MSAPASFAAVEIDPLVIIKCCSVVCRGRLLLQIVNQCGLRWWWCFLVVKREGSQGEHKYFFQLLEGSKHTQDVF